MRSLKFRSRGAFVKALIRCPLYLRKQTSLSSGSMSALCHFRTNCIAAKWVLFDHLVGAAEHRLRNSEAERLSGL
jgi:hypothetical protein